MKNFRKVLALVLVVATLFSFVAMTSAKSLEDYSDAADVRYVEAVEVLSALGIINGYEDDTFRPDGLIDRDEMAKMVATLRNAGDIDPTLYASANKFADCESSWAKGYIAYCAQLGIVAGRNASTFDPEGKVTGIEVLKMLLCTLGYVAEEQGYVGANWQVNVLRDARKSDLLSGLGDMNPYEAATRDQAAQMFLNALKANMVYGYVSESIVKLTNSLYMFNRTPVATPDALQKGWEVAYCNAILSDAPLYLIFGGVSCEPQMDCFGRPATLWIVKNKHGAELLRKTFAAAPDFTYTEDVKLQNKLGDIFSSKQGNANPRVTTYINGTFERTANTLAAASGFTGNGILTEVFVDDDEVIIVIIETFISRVKAVGKMPATVELENGYKFKNTLGLKKDDYVMYHQCAGAVKPSTLAPGNHMDAIAVSHPSNTVAKTVYLHDITIAEPTVETVIHSSLGKHSDFLDVSFFETADEKFEYAWNYNKSGVYADGSFSWILGRAAMPLDLLSVTNLTVTPNINGVMDKHNVYDVFMNEHGYVMYYKPHTEDYDYQYGYIVEDSHDAGATTVVDGVRVTERFFDIVDFSANYNKDIAAEEETWQRTVIVDGGMFNDGTADRYEPGHLVRYIMNEDGQAEVLTSNDYGVKVEGGYVVPGISAIRDINDGTVVLANNDTQYMVRTYNWATGEYTYDVYVGYRNLPTTLLGYKYVNDGKWFGPDDGEYIHTLQYLVGNGPDDDKDIATHVFIDAVYAGVEQNFYLLSAVSLDSEMAMYPFINDYHVYKVLIDGEEAYIAVANDDAWRIGTVPPANVKNDLYTAKIQAMNLKTIGGYDLYVALTPVAPVTWNVVAVNSGLLTVDWLNNTLAIEHGHVQIADDAVINVVHPVLKDDEWLHNEPAYATFAGENRDADFAAFFEYYDWDIASMKVYATFEEISGWLGSVQEVTELWIELIPAQK